VREFASVEEAAQAYVGMLYDGFEESLILLRLFITVSYGDLPATDRQFVDKRADELGITHHMEARTPILTLLGTRGRRAEWNDRQKSKRYRCIPLVSTEFVASLPMLSMQLRSMAFDLNLIDVWEEAVIAKGRADMYRGMLYIRDAGCDRDEHGRMIVPVQEFVVANNVKTVLGVGSGYANHPALLTLFAFTNEIINKREARPLATQLDAFKSLSGELVGQGCVFGKPRGEL
jgi:hypothetical protein